MEGSGVWVLSCPVKALLRATALTSLPRQMGAQHFVSLLLQFRGPGCSPDFDPLSLNTLLSSSRPGSPTLGCPAILICTRMCEGVSLYLAYVHPLHSAPLTEKTSLVPVHCCVSCVIRQGTMCTDLLLDCAS